MRMSLMALVIFMLMGQVYAKTYKPYILASESNSQIKQLVPELKKNLTANGFKVVGEYMPADDKDRYIIVITNNELLSAVKKFGGLRGFGGVIRIGLTSEGGKTQISYSNPYYWGNAYFQDDYNKVVSTFRNLNSKLQKALSIDGKSLNSEFGSDSGIQHDDLRDYHYMISMPYFEDVVDLASFNSYDDAINKIEGNLKSSKNIHKVYRIDYPGKNLTLYGIGLSGKTGEAHFLPIIDIDKPKHTASLPYELLVNDKEVVMLHGRYRIAVSFPDLGMVTFTKIMNTPGDIEDIMKSLVK